MAAITKSHKPGGSQTHTQWLLSFLEAEKPKIRTPLNPVFGEGPLAIDSCPVTLTSRGGKHLSVILGKVMNPIHETVPS